MVCDSVTDGNDDMRRRTHLEHCNERGWSSSLAASYCDAKGTARSLTAIVSTWVCGCSAGCSMCVWPLSCEAACKCKNDGDVADGSDV